MRMLKSAVALALFLGLLAAPGLAATKAHASGYRNGAPARYLTVSEARRTNRPVVRRYYYGRPYYDYYYNQPGISIGLPFFYFHAG